MHMTFRNVNDAFQTLVAGIHTGAIPTERKPSRVGDVLQIVEPCLITYTRPRERVLFNTNRDCNPFFHMFESLWMLAGRNDVAPLAYYSSKIGDVASDDGKTFNGAYGLRWRGAQLFMAKVKPEFQGSHDLEVDQLKIVIDQLKRKPESRRVVLQMWNVEDDLLKIDVTKDVCCNTAAYFSIREEKWPKFPESPRRLSELGKFLDMTVTNRSNDLIWGMLGANVVHFSFLQEYLAAAIGVEVGVYNQFTNNLHVYTETNGGFHPEKWLDGMPDRDEMDMGECYARDVEDQTVNGGVLPTQFLCGDKITDAFDGELRRFVNDWREEWVHPFLRTVAKPMCEAFSHHKSRKYGLAMEAINRCQAEDWRCAGKAWLTKREVAWRTRTQHDPKVED